MFWIVTCFIRVCLLKREAVVTVASHVYICIKYFGPRAPQSFNPALYTVRPTVKVRVESGLCLSLNVRHIGTVLRVVAEHIRQN